MEIRSEDILNLANAYAVVLDHKEMGRGYALTGSSQDNLRDALENATELYNVGLKRALAKEKYGR